MSKSQKRALGQMQQELPTAPSIPIEAVVRENQSEDLVPLLEAHEEERVAKALAGEKAESWEQQAPQAKEESTAEGLAHEDKLAEKPADKAGDMAREKAEDKATDEAKKEAREGATQGSERVYQEAAELPTELWQEFPPDVDVADVWYDDPDFLTLQRDEGLADLPAVRVTAASLSKVVSEAKKLGKKANELNRTGAHQRHLAVIARWYEGDRWLAIHDFLLVQGRRPEWVPLYEGAGLTAKQVSRATRLRRAFPKVVNLKKIATLEEAEALATNILNNKKPKRSAPAKGTMEDTGAGAASSLVASATGNMPDTGTGQVAPDEGKAEENVSEPVEDGGMEESMLQDVVLGTLQIGPGVVANAEADAFRSVSAVDRQRKLLVCGRWDSRAKKAVARGIAVLVLPELQEGCRP